MSELDVTSPPKLTNTSVTDDVYWIEQTAVHSLGFRVWHVMFFCLSGFLTIVILICCCVKIRIPRTKQEIEADYQRKKIARKFRQRLCLIHNQDMDNMDLKLALDRVQKGIYDENDFIEPNCEAIHSLTGSMKAEPQQPIEKPNFGKRLSTLMKFSKTKNVAEDGTSELG